MPCFRAVLVRKGTNGKFTEYFIKGNKFYDPKMFLGKYIPEVLGLLESVSSSFKVNFRLSCMMKKKDLKTGKNESGLAAFCTVAYEAHGNKHNIDENYDESKWKMLDDFVAFQKNGSG